VRVMRGVDRWAWTRVNARVDERRRDDWTIWNSRARGRGDVDGGGDVWWMRD